MNFLRLAPALAAAVLGASFALAQAPQAANPTVDWKRTDEAWRDRADRNLRQDNGWLTLAGRFPMKPGANTFGTGEKNDLVFAKGLGPERMGTITVDKGKVSVKLAQGLTMTKDGVSFDEYVFSTSPGKPDWVTIGRLAMHVIEREGKYILRLADNESEVRAQFGGRTWYDLKDSFRVEATFHPYKDKKIAIVNVLDEVSQEVSPGYVEFKLDGRTHRLDAVGDEGLFFVLRDGTSGDTTYRPSRFLYVDAMPKAGEKFMLDFNKAYNPPCAFSEFTTCPLPPEQNILKVRIEAGETYPPKKLTKAS
jgi:uncharacterized protein (DUF1684 family)